MQLKIYSAEIAPSEVLYAAFSEEGSAAGGLSGAGGPGRIVSDGKNYLYITTNDGAISLKEVQIAGKRRMDIKAFLLGFREPESYSTTPGTSKAEIAKTKVTA